MPQILKKMKLDGKMPRLRIIWRYRLMVRTNGSQPLNQGSIPCSATTRSQHRKGAVFVCQIDSRKMSDADGRIPVRIFKRQNRSIPRGAGRLGAKDAWESYCAGVRASNAGGFGRVTLGRQARHLTHTRSVCKLQVARSLTSKLP